MVLDSLTLTALGIAVLISAGFAAVIARTAKSKGYSYKLFFIFGFISYLITSVIAVFIRPKGQPEAKPKISSVALLLIGIIVEFAGLGSLPDNSAENGMKLEVTDQVLGSLFVAFAGILIIIGSVANDYRNQKTEVKSL